MRKADHVDAALVLFTLMAWSAVAWVFLAPNDLAPRSRWLAVVSAVAQTVLFAVATIQKHKSKEI